MAVILPDPALPVLVDFRTVLEFLTRKMDGVSDLAATDVSQTDVQQTQSADTAANNDVDVLANLTSAIRELQNAAQLTIILNTQLAKP